jgi:hypothetical protein
MPRPQAERALHATGLLAGVFTKKTLTEAGCVVAAEDLRVLMRSLDGSGEFQASVFDIFPV